MATKPFYSSGEDQQFVAPQAAGSVLMSNGPGLTPSFQAQNVQIVQVELTSTQLKALPTAVSILAAPPAGKMYAFGGQLVMQFKAKTTAYTLGNADNELDLVYHGNTTEMAGVSAAGLVDQAVNTVAGALGEVPLVAQSVAEAKGIDLILKGTTPALTLGDGTLKVTFAFQVVDLS